MTSKFWGDDRGDDEGGVAVEVIKKAEWVCPNCGFSSADPAVFIPSHPEPSGPATASAAATAALAPSSPQAAVDAATPSLPQPQQHSEPGGQPEASATAVLSPPIAVPEPEPAVAVSAPAPPPQPLPPPAWLTAAVVDYDEGVDDVETDDSQPSEPHRQN
jgi:hypothetical protein